MSLSSPRFKNLNTSRPYRRGSTGYSVHLIQQALYDLGFTSSLADGIFGPRTHHSVEEFQRKNRLTIDGIIGKETIRNIDQKVSSYEYRVGIHYRSINLTNVPFRRIWQSTQDVYAQYGIKMEIASGMSLRLTEEQSNRFFMINGRCRWVISSGEYHELHSMGSNVSPNEILVYYVNRFSEHNLMVGCGGHATNRPAATVASHGTRWTTAHEIGHVLLTSNFEPIHSSSRRNLMFRTLSSSENTPILSTEQILQIRSHRCCKMIK